jgi:hypothetical protein
MKDTSMFDLSATDRATLRALARRVTDIAAQPRQAQNADMWRRHNDLERVRPMVLAFPEGAWRELLPDSQLTCTHPWARAVETDLRRRIYSDAHLRDDNVTDAVLPCPITIHMPPLGLEMRRTGSDQATGAFHIEQTLVTDADIDRIVVAEPAVDWADTERRFAFMQDLLGDVLTIEKRGCCGGRIAPVDAYSHLRGLDAFFLDFVDRPEFAHRAIERLTRREVVIMQSLERQGALSLGNGNHYAGSGGTSYTRQLPQPDFDGIHVRTRDLWGFVSAQIFSDVSPAMHEEFALRHERVYLDLFGLNCYGCCEPLHRKLDIVFRHVPRLRRVSISPWAAIAPSAQALGRRCIFSWKPNPATLAADSWDPAQVRQALCQVCRQTRGNVMEMIMKDTHTVRNDPRRLWDWVRIAREVAEEFA